MAENFYLDPDGLDDAVRAMRVHGLDLSEAYAELKGVLDAHHGCWGADDIGNAFAQNYAPQSADFTTNSKQAADSLPSLSDDIRESSRVFQSVDEDNARQIDKAPDTS